MITLIALSGLHLTHHGDALMLIPSILIILYDLCISQELMKSIIEASRKDASKDTCFAALIHELRNPLTSYSYNSELLGQ